MKSAFPDQINCSRYRPIRIDPSHHYDRVDENSIIQSVSFRIYLSRSLSLFPSPLLFLRALLSIFLRALQECQSKLWKIYQKNGKSVHYFMFDFRWFVLCFVWIFCVWIGSISCSTNWFPIIMESTLLLRRCSLSRCLSINVCVCMCVCHH